MSRNGKIARLPRQIRDELNLRLENNEEGPKLLGWLNGLAETRELLDRDFEGVAISKQNLSEWRQGGFREWQIRGDLHDRAYKLCEQTRELEEVVDAPELPNGLATALALRYAKVLATWDGQPDKKIEAEIEILRKLCWDLAILQRTMERAADQKTNYHKRLEDERKEFDEAMKKRILARFRQCCMSTRCSPCLPITRQEENWRK
jgi:hypothetical protein